MLIEELLRRKVNEPNLSGSKVESAAVIGLGLIGAAMVIAEAIKYLADRLWQVRR